MLLINNIREDIIIQLMGDSLNILILLYISDLRLERREWKEKKFKKKNTRKKLISILIIKKEDIDIYYVYSRFECKD